jgi:regulatory protein SWI5
MKLLRQLSAEGFTQTPPMSPGHSSSPSEVTNDNDSSHAQIENKSLHKSPTTPSRTSLSNQFTTPPTSPIESTQDDLDDLFNDFENAGSSQSQYELEMKAMTDFTSFDSNEPYEILDFM